MNFTTDDLSLPILSHVFVRQTEYPKAYQASKISVVQVPSGTKDFYLENIFTGMRVSDKSKDLPEDVALEPQDLV